METCGRFASAVFFTALGTAFCILPAGLANAAPQLKSIGPCIPQTSLGVCFGAPPIPSNIRNIGYTAPAAGTVLVMVSGSGYCVFQDGTTEQTADFETQITDSPTAVANHKGAGGLRIKARLPKTTTASPLTVPFNLNSSRTFPVTTGQSKNFIFAGHAIKFDSHVACYAFGINMTVLFIPQ